MGETYSSSESSSHSLSRARYVMGKIWDDLYAILSRGFVDAGEARINRLREDIEFLLINDVLTRFQLQFRSGEKSWAVEYKVFRDGSISVDRDSGGINYYEIPADAKFRAAADWSRSKQHVEEYMTARGWTNTGQWVSGSSISGGAYSKNGFGVNKTRIGSWETE